MPALIVTALVLVVTAFLGPRPASNTMLLIGTLFLISALANLGYSRGEAEKGVERALRADGAGRFEDVLRRALQAMAGR